MPPGTKPETKALPRASAVVEEITLGSARSANSVEQLGDGVSPRVEPRRK